MATQCPFCKQNWSALPSVIEIVPAYQQSLEKLQNTAQIGVYLQALTAALVHVWRPFDNELLTIQRLPNQSVKELSADLTHAYRVLNEQGHIDSWKQKLLTVRGPELASLGENAVMLPLRSLMRATHQMQALTLSSSKQMDLSIFEFKEREELVPLARKKLATNSPGLLRYQLDTSALARLLDISNAELNVLVDKGVVSPLNPSVSIRERWFDLRALKKVFNRIPIYQSESETLNLYEQERYLKIHGMSFGLALAMVFCGSLHAIRPANSTSLKTLRVKSSELEDLASRHLAKMLTEHQETKWVSSWLNVSEPAVKEIVRSGILKWASWWPCGTMVDGVSLSSFNDNYISLQRHGYLNKVRPCRIAESLKGKGLHPTLKNDEVIIYERSELLLIELQILKVTTIKNKAPSSINS
ncbi:hypothetical protein [Zobellella taiwanensis]